MARTVYFKRYRMEMDLAGLPPVPELPVGFSWLPWDDDYLDTHAHVKFRSFFGELDATVFPSLSDLDGCVALMRAIRAKQGFCPGATWLLNGPGGYCGTIQGVTGQRRCGAIQNLGVVAGHRGLGLGKALLLRALHGFGDAGLRRASLEVTARNESVVAMYRRVGFRCRKTLYRAVEVEAPRTVEELPMYEVSSELTPLPTV